MKSLRLLEKLLKNSGIFTEPFRVPSYTDEPKFYQYFVALNANGEEVNHEDVYGYGIDDAEDISKAKSIGEAIERYSLYRKVDKGNVIFGSFNDLVGQKAVDPKKFAGLPLRVQDDISGEFLNDLNFSWTRGFDLLNDSEILLPLQFVKLFNFEEYWIREPLSTGTAFGVSWDAAFRSALYESIERDAFMTSYLKRKRLREIVLDTPKTKLIKKYFERYYLEPRVYDITNENIGVPSVMTILLDKSEIGPGMTISASTDSSFERASIKSLFESQQSRIWLRQKHILEGNVSLREDEIEGIEERCIYWYPKEMLEKLDYWIGENSKVKLSDMDYSQKRLRSVVNDLSNQGMDVYVVDLSPEFLNKERVLKVIVPQLQPLYLNEKNALVMANRFKGYPVGELNKVPHPFS